VTGADVLDALTVDAREHRWTTADDFPEGTTDEEARIVLARLGLTPSTPAVSLAAGEPGSDDLGREDLEADDLGPDVLGLDDLGPDELGADDLGTGDLGRSDVGRDDLGPDGLGADDLGLDDLGTGDLGRDDGGAGLGDPGAGDRRSGGSGLDDLGLDGLGAGDRRLRLVTASSIVIRRPTFLWDRRLPDSAVSLFAGREGLGKTVLATWLAARVTQGQLTGSRLGRPADIVYVGTEDDRATVLVPRLLAAGADLERAHFVDLALDGSYSIARDAVALAHQLDRIEPGLVIIDPVDAHLGGGVDSHKKSEVQAALGILARLAQRFDCAVLAVAHLNKGDSRDVLTKVVGSVGFTTSVRAVLAVGEHPDDPADRVCVLRKANMADAAAVPAFRYRVESVAVEAPGGAEPIDTAGVVVLGEEHGLDPNAILSIPDAEERTARDEAADWLLDVLADGPLPAKTVKRMAAEADIAVRTLQRARAGLGVVVRRDRHAQGRPSSWSLPGSVPERSGQSPSVTDGTITDTRSDQGLPFGDRVTCHDRDSGPGTKEEGS